MVPLNLKNYFDKIVLVIGAGASREMGCKLSQGMLVDLGESINNLSPVDKPYYEFRVEFSEIYKFIMASLHYQSTMKAPLDGNPTEVNIEDFVFVLRQLIDKEYIVPYPLIGNWNEKITKWELKNQDLFQIFLNFTIYLLVTKWTEFNLASAIDQYKPVLDLLHSSENIVLNVFSLNYDLVLEKVFNTATSRVLDNGFSEKTIDNQLIKYWAADFANDQNKTKINLYKLHGSIDWVYKKESESIVMKENIYDNQEPLIIYGSSTKMLSFDPFLFFLSKFREYLEKSTVFIVIGYSFHDKYINNMLIQQVNQNTETQLPKKMLIVGPNEKETESSFSEKIKKIQESKSINDVINFRSVSPERLMIINKTAKDFFQEYFADSGKKLIEIFDSISKSGEHFT